MSLMTKLFINNAYIFPSVPYVLCNNLVRILCCAQKITKAYNDN